MDTLRVFFVEGFPLSFPATWGGLSLTLLQPVNTTFYNGLAFFQTHLVHLPSYLGEIPTPTELGPAWVMARLWPIGLYRFAADVLWPFYGVCTSLAGSPRGN